MKVLLCIGGGIGNVIMATPAAFALAELGYQVSVYLQPEAAAAAPLLAGWGALREVITGAPPSARPEAVEGFDLAVHTVWSRRRGLHPRELVPGPVDLRATHEAEANMIPVRGLGHVGPIPPAHVVSGRAKPKTAPREYYVVAPGCKADPFWRRKRLAEDTWARTCELLGRGTSGERRVVCLGSEGEYAGAGAINLTGRTSLGQAATWIAHARAVVAVDNGLAHGAAALGVPTVVLFGATSVVKNRPLGPRLRVMTLPLACRPCQMTPAGAACSVWRCTAFDPARIERAVKDIRRGPTE